MVYWEMIADFVAGCLEASNAQSKDVQNLAAFLVSAFEGSCTLWATDPHGTPLSRLSKTGNQHVDAYLEMTQS